MKSKTLSSSSQSL